MRSRALPAVGISVAALVLTAFAGTASAAAGPTAVATSGGVDTSQSRTTLKTCFANVDGDSGVGIVSQNFEAAFDIYDNSGAADFTLDTKCKLKQVTAYGVYFNGFGPATSETVTIYKNKKGKPGKVKTSQTVTGSDAAGTFTIKLKKKKLKPGKYFVGVVANLDFSVGGEWGWETTINKSGNGDMWQNPGDGFATGCTSWGDMVSCLGAQGQGPDFMVQLDGK